MNGKFGSNVLDQVKQKVFYRCEYMSGFQKFKEKLTGKKIVIKSVNMFLKLGMKTMKDYHDIYLLSFFIII